MSKRSGLGRTRSRSIERPLGAGSPGAAMAVTDDVGEGDEKSSGMSVNPRTRVRSSVGFESGGQGEAVEELENDTEAMSVTGWGMREPLGTAGKLDFHSAGSSSKASPATSAALVQSPPEPPLGFNPRPASHPSVSPGHTPSMNSPIAGRSSPHSLTLSDSLDFTSNPIHWPPSPGHQREGGSPGAEAASSTYPQPYVPGKGGTGRSSRHSSSGSIGGRNPSIPLGQMTMAGSSSTSIKTPESSRSNASSPQSSVSSIGGLSARRVSGPELARPGSMSANASSAGGIGARNPFFMPESFAAAGERLSPPTDVKMSPSGGSSEVGDAQSDRKEAASGQLNWARQVLNDERASGQERNSFSSQGSSAVGGSGSPDTWQSSGSAIQRVSGIPTSPQTAMRRSSSDDGRSSGGSPSRYRNEGSARLHRLSMDTIGAATETGVVAPSTLLGVEPQVLSPVRYSSGSPSLADDARQEWLTSGSESLIAGGSGSSQPESSHRRSSSRAEVGRWSTAREARQASPSRFAASSPIVPQLQRSISHEGPPRPARAQTTDGSVGNAQMWDSVWPDTTTRAVDPVTALPVSCTAVASPSLAPLVPPLVMHSRSMSASVSTTSPGTPSNNPEAFAHFSQGRRDSNAALFGRPSSSFIPKRSGSAGGVSPPGSPLITMKSPAKSLPSYKGYDKTHGTGRSGGSPSGDKSESPFNAQDMPAFSAPRGPGSPRQIPTVMNRFFSGDSEAPAFIFTLPTPPTGTPEISTSAAEVSRATEQSSLDKYPPLALPPAVATPSPAPGDLLNDADGVSLGDNRASAGSSATAQQRPVPPPFRRAVSHITAPSPPLLPAPSTFRTRSFSGSNMARPPLTSRNSGGKIRAGPPSPNLPSYIPSPTSSPRAPFTSLPLELPADAETAVVLEATGAPLSSLDDFVKPAGPPSEGSLSPVSVGRVSDADADDEASPPLASEVLELVEEETDTESIDDLSAMQSIPTPMPAAGVNGDADEVMAAPTDSLPADVAFEDEGLSTLERIFLLSKSEHAFHRAYIARMLGELLEDTDPCEAVEYVLPLLTGFALDEDESVKEAFASQLHKVLWYFFTACDLIGEEDQIFASEDASSDPVFTVTSKGVRAVRRSNTSVDRPHNPSHFQPSSGSGSSGSGQLSSDGSSAGTSLESHRTSTVSASTVPTLLTPTSSVATPSSVATADTGESVHRSAAVDRSNSYKDSVIGNEEETAGPLIERPVIAVHTFTPLIGSLLLSQNSLVADPSRAAVVAILAKLRRASNPVLDEWTEERPEDSRISYTAQSGTHSHEFPIFSVASRRMVQKELLEGIVFGIGRLEGDRSDASEAERSQQGLAVSEELDAAETEAAFLKQQLAQEAILGRAISMNLIASISEFLHPHEIARYDLVTEVARTLEDEAGVKAEAALALAYLAKLAPQDNLELMLSIFEHFVEDETESVRQSACLCLPALSKRIESREDRRSYTVRAFEALLLSGDLVEYTLLEIIGEIIHIFQEDPEGPPEALLEVFYSQAPLSLASTEAEVVREFDNLDRAIVSAFNLPAVCLALGPERWHELRPTYKALCNINHPRIIASLAASLHEIAKILGPEIAATDLLHSFNEYINDGDEAKTKALAGLPVFISYLPVDRSVEVVNDLSNMWRNGSFSNWHHREALASHFAALLQHMASVSMPGPVIELLELGLADTFNAIREATITNMPSCYEAVRTDQASRDEVLELLQNLAVSRNFKQRRTFIACVEAFVRQRPDPELFEKHFMDDLAVLSDDLLDVRIMVAKCLRPICARDGLYPHSVFRPLRLNEIIERLSNDDSNYVREPIQAIMTRPRMRPSATSSAWLGGPAGPGVLTPSSTGSHPSHGDRRSSSASMLIRADSDTTTIRAERHRLSPDKRDDAGTQSAPSELMYVPWESPDPTLNGSLRPVSMQEAQQILGLEAEPVKVGMKDPFSATFGRAVAKAQSEAGHDLVIKRT